MFLSGLRRLLLLFCVLTALTSAASVVLGALAHANLARAVAEGFYVVGAAILVCSFVLGARGPLRADWGDSETGGSRPRAGVLPRSIRRSTPEERTEAKHNSLALFALGIVLLLIGGAVDPTRRVF